MKRLLITLAIVIIVVIALVIIMAREATAPDESAVSVSPNISVLP